MAVEAVKADNEGTRDQVTDQVARAYLTGLRAEASLETAKANVELSEALLKLAQSQKAAGTGTGIEITRADVNWPTTTNGCWWHKTMSSAPICNC